MASEEILQQGYSYINRSYQRVDALDKVTGKIKFFSDMKIEGMLFARVFRSSVAHANIVTLDTTEAERLQGVRAVLTYKDVPGLNAYGAIIPDAPVLGYGKVRFYGEPLALVAADDQETAEKALGLIKAVYEPLPAVHSMDESLKPEAPKLHDRGNIARHALIIKGDVDRAFKDAHLTLERTYMTQSQKHMFLEPEAGIAYTDELGNLNILAGGQNPYRDKMQVARSLNISPEKVRVINYPAGGAFGGKDDVTVQIHLALLATKTKRPVKLVWNREESGIGGFHRHPSLITLKTAVSDDGRLLANDSRIYLDTGAYQSFGPTVLDVTIEVINGPYLIPNIRIDANLVYTNNGISSAFRGFGGPQGNFAIESMMDEMAEEMKMDPIDFRLKNLAKSGDIGPFGNSMRNMEGIHEALSRLRNSPLWQLGKELPPKPWIRRGTGIAIAIKGVGFGTIPDYPTAAVELLPQGKIKVLFSNPDYGQGVNTGNAQIVAEALDLPMNEIEVVNADTQYSPDTGSSSASRGTFTSGNALLVACNKMLDRLRMEAALYLESTRDGIEYASGRFLIKGNESKSVSIYDLAKGLRAKGETLKFEGTFEVPRYPEPVKGTLEVPHVVYMYGAMVSSIELNTLTGYLDVKNVDLMADIGNVINPLLATTQCEGGIVQGLGFATSEELVYNQDEKPMNTNYTTYIVPSIADIPKIYVEFIKTYEQYGPYGAKGMAEIPIVPVGASIANALKQASGVRYYQLPLTPGRVLSKLHDQGQG